MNDPVQQAVEQAVGRAFDAWAAEHPSLAAVIDRIALTERSVASLRETDAYRAAVAAYHRDRSQAELVSRLTDAAAGVLGRLLA
jgi:ferric-dicitrate binding protein FerR (iron transport regulator)